MKIFLFLNLSESIPDPACDKETKASPNPSKNPKKAIGAPKKVVTNSGQIGLIISEPKSLRYEAKEKILTFLGKDFSFCATGFVFSETLVDAVGSSPFFVNSGIKKYIPITSKLSAKVGTTLKNTFLIVLRLRSG